MVRSVLTHVTTHLRDVLRPTLLALFWCTLLVYLKRWTLATPTAASPLDDPPPAYTSIDFDRTWKDLEWASYRIIASLSTVTGLLLAFRSNSATERWSTARRKWSDVQSTSRSLLRLLGASLLTYRGTGKLESLEDFAQDQGVQRKVEATIAAIPFFSISLMAEMRGRALELFSGDQRRLLRQDLIKSLPSVLIAAANRSEDDASLRMKPNKEAEKRKQLANLNSPHIAPPSPSSSSDRYSGSVSAPSNLALSSLIYLQSSIDSFHTASVLSGPVYAHSIGLVNSLTSHMTELERIRDTSIPLSVSRHFSRLLFIHTVLLPIVVVQKLSERWWLCTTIVGVVTNMLYGVDSFAAMLGQPFGLEREDLPLEKYVAQAQEEWEEVTRSCIALRKE